MRELIKIGFLWGELCYINKFIGMSTGSFGFATEVEERVVKTADRLRSTQIKSSAYNKLKEAKQKAKQV